MWSDASIIHKVTWTYRLKRHCAVDDLNRLLGLEWLTRVWTFEKNRSRIKPGAGVWVILWSVLQQSLEFYHDDSVISNDLSPVKSDDIETWWSLLIVWTNIPRPTRSWECFKVPSTRQKEYHGIPTTRTLSTHKVAY